MTRTTNARLAGFMFLFYIATGISSLFLFRQATGGAEGTAASLGLLSVATASTAAAPPDAAAGHALGALLLQQGDAGTLIAASCFAAGSMLYSYLFLRARSIPVLLAWLGVLASLLLVAALTLQLAGFLRGPVIYYVWIPMAGFEVALGLWLLIKGVAAPGEDSPSSYGARRVL